MVRPVHNYDQLTSSLDMLNRLEVNSSRYRNVNCSNDDDLFNNKKFLIIKIQRIIVRYLETQLDCQKLGLEDVCNQL